MSVYRRGGKGRQVDHMHGREKEIEVWLVEERVRSVGVGKARRWVPDHPLRRYVLDHYPIDSRIIRGNGTGRMCWI